MTTIDRSIFHARRDARLAEVAPCHDFTMMIRVFGSEQPKEDRRELPDYT
jgi:hypothetical protein